MLLRFRIFMLACLGMITMTAQNSIALASEFADTAYQFSFTSIDGQPLPLSDFQGQVVLVVNTASRCGFTPQYDGLQALYDKYREQGLVVLGVPSGDFGEQELADEAEIKRFCEVNFNIDFPMTEKNHVKGDNAHPFYQWSAETAGFMARPRWNFHKYLVGRDGQIDSWFSSVTSPQSEKIETAILRALAQPAG